MTKQKTIREMIRMYRSASQISPTTGEKNGKPSEARPDQSLTPRQILSRFAAGTLPAIQQDDYYSEDLPDVRGMDIHEFHELSKQTDYVIKKNAQDRKNADEAAREESKRKKIIEEYEASRSPLQENTEPTPPSSNPKNPK